MALITESNRKWWILAAMTTGISMIFVDTTVLPVTLPTLHRELLISDLQLQWIINSYTLVLTVLVLAGGRLGDMWGMKKAFCLGILLFSFASLLCGFSTSAEWLIFSRCLQGVGGAFLVPATQSIVYSSFPPHQRGKALGIFVSAGSIFLSLGPLIGGSLTQYLSWRYVFWINLPIALVGLVMALITVLPIKGNKEKFDYWGFVTILIGVTSIIVGLMQAQDWGWKSFETISLFLIGMLFLILHFKMHKKAVHPLVDFNLFKKRSFIGGMNCFVLSQFLIIATIFWAIYFQNILHFSPSKAGTLSFLANIPILVAAPLAGFLVDRFGPRCPVMIGYGLIIFGLSWFLSLNENVQLFHLFLILIPFGIGVPMTFMPASISILSDVQAEKRGIVSGLNATLRQFSATLGLAVFGTLSSTIQLFHIQQALQTRPELANLNVKNLEGLLAKVPSAMKVVNSLSNENAAFVTQTVKEAFLSSIFSINFLALSLAVVGFLSAYRLLSNRPFHIKS